VLKHVEPRLALLRAKVPHQGSARRRDRDRDPDRDRAPNRIVRESFCGVRAAGLDLDSATSSTMFLDCRCSSLRAREQLKWRVAITRNRRRLLVVGNRGDIIRRRVGLQAGLGDPVRKSERRSSRSALSKLSAGGSRIGVLAKGDASGMSECSTWNVRGACRIFASSRDGHTWYRLWVQ
jgi:hypothetical protein